MTDVAPTHIEAGASLSRDAWRRLRKNHLAAISFFLLLAMIFLVIVGPWVSRYSYETQDRELGAAPPSVEHWFGTDDLGRDLFTRILYGGRISLMVGLCATAVSLGIGVIYGAVAGFAGGRVDSALMRVVDILYTLPFTIIVIILTVYLGKSIVLIFMAIGAVEWLTMARIVRGQVVALRNKEFVEAAYVMGLRRRRIVLRHLIPNALGPIIVYTTLTIPQVMLLEAVISFLGLGVQAPMSSWGVLIQDGAKVMEDNAWRLIFPSMFLSITLFSLNFLGDGLRDALDPRISKD
ncbi:MAG: ABC transporter permease subunit [Candidatus Hydrogenedentes bacterium]|nr:ABC transporter permease subunit [Candidatus Hydrogenedentota bacterium]